MDKLSELKELALIWSRSDVACMLVEEFADVTQTPLEDARVMFGAANALDNLIERNEELLKDFEAAEAQVKELEENSQKQTFLFMGIKLRAETAEAELAQLRAQEPVGIFVKCGDIWYETDSEDGVNLYADPRPTAAVVPPEMIVKLDGLIKWIEQLPIPTNSATKWLIEMHAFREQFIALSGQPQKPVNLPAAWSTDNGNDLLDKDSVIEAIKAAGGEVE